MGLIYYLYSSEAKLENSIKLFSTATATTAAENSNACFSVSSCQQQAKQKVQLIYPVWKLAWKLTLSHRTSNPLTVLS